MSKRISVIVLAVFAILGTLSYQYYESLKKEQERTNLAEVQRERGDAIVKWHHFVEQIGETGTAILMPYEIQGQRKGLTLDRQNRITILYPESEYPGWNQLFDFVYKHQRVEAVFEPAKGTFIKGVDEGVRHQITFEGTNLEMLIN